MTKKILAVASAGGHWQQLMLMRPAFAAHEVHYITTLKGLSEQFGASPASLVPDCNRNTALRATLCFVKLIGLILRIRPDVVISTGALPGVIALALGRAVGAQTIWVDSVANAQEMSSSGRLAKRFARLCLSQWETPARAEGVDFAGSIL
ncbi:MAG: UDP-N-acetylglucosamine--LPS N-acetylglucosamine transferase [Litoreibacter sp.]|nr:UDP-N-acetylglucosamine--LPS N-acetylglucosamine transferase [Litoreibacter sp.]